MPHRFTSLTYLMSTQNSAKWSSPLPMVSSTYSFTYLGEYLHGSAILLITHSWFADCLMTTCQVLPGGLARGMAKRMDQKAWLSHDDRALAAYQAIRLDRQSACACNCIFTGGDHVDLLMLLTRLVTHIS